MTNKIMKVLLKKNEKIKYNAALSITGVIKGASQNNLYSKLGFAALKFRHWCRKLCPFYKIKERVNPVCPCSLEV